MDRSDIVENYPSESEMVMQRIKSQQSKLKRAGTRRWCALHVINALIISSHKAFSSVDDLVSYGYEVADAMLAFENRERRAPIESLSWQPPLYEFNAEVPPPVVPEVEDFAELFNDEPIFADGDPTSIPSSKVLGAVPPRVVSGNEVELMGSIATQVFDSTLESAMAPFSAD